MLKTSKIQLASTGIRIINSTQDIFSENKTLNLSHFCLSSEFMFFFFKDGYIFTQKKRQQH